MHLFRTTALVYSDSSSTRKEGPVEVMKKLAGWVRPFWKNRGLTYRTFEIEPIKLVWSILQTLDISGSSITRYYSQNNMMQLGPDFAFRNDTPYLALTDELWGVFQVRELFKEIWPRYIESALYCAFWWTSSVRYYRMFSGAMTTNFGSRTLTRKCRHFDKLFVPGSGAFSNGNLITMTIFPL